MIIRKFLVVCVLVLGLFGNAIADLNSGLVAYYPFDGNTNDASGNHHNGTEVGGIEYVNGYYGQAAKFDGINDLVSIQNHLDFNDLSSLTLSIWIKTNSNNVQPETSNGWGYLFVKAVDYDFQYGIAIDGKVDQVMATSWRYPGGGIYTAISPYNQIKDGKWHMLTAVITESYSSLYIDGVLKQKDDVASGYSWNVSGNANVTIGGRFGDNDNWGYVKGVLDDARFYNRALSSSEIQALYTKKSIPSSNSSSSCTSPQAITVSENLDIQILSLNYTSLLGTQNLWINLKYYGKGSNGEILWKLKDFGTNP